MNISRHFHAFSLSVLGFLFVFGPGAGPEMLSAQTSTIITDEDALFGDAAPDTLAPGPAPAAGAADAAQSSAGVVSAASASSASSAGAASSSSAVSAFLTRDQVRIGGSFTGKLGTSFTWTNPWEGNRDPLNPDKSTLDPAIASTLFFDARPQEDLRFYGSIKTAWPFTNSATFLTDATYVELPSPSVTTKSASFSTVNLQVFELFTDFSWNDAAYFRFGKHTVKWGVGYFFSPADVLNLTSIDVTNPTAQREGPISLRALLPIPGSQNNLWGYLLLPGALPSGSTSGETEAFKPQDLAYAGKGEFLLGNWEIGLGAYYKNDKAPRLITTATGSLGRFDLFAEAVASWGNDRQYVTSLTPTPAFESRDDRWYFQGTAGFLYTARDGYTSIAAQYYFNGEGYSYEERENLINQYTALPQTLQDSLAPVLGGLLYGASQHYGALSISRSELFIKDVSASILVMANLADLSGFITPSLNYKVFKYMNLSLSPTFVWYIDALWGTGKNSEYILVNKGPALTISLSAALGSGRF
ncbi:hypothetical protein [Gracilinema caldarium]|uniref:hypothetical protein n=1 Tax=Gracilinema caldarium TaxID=215591 RepID=UPI0026E9C794|nr:hypothetical protein [Gracilinema caldarium]